jgi:myo-inositol 2-dehydrogenase/D-chiro-inositol 1-dehydrogenase
MPPPAGRSEVAPLRIGVIGYGLFGRLHARSIGTAPDGVLAAIAARGDESAARATADHPRLRIHRDYRELLARDDLDMVTVATPNHLHAELAIAALDAGKHVLLEKPMATSLADCDRILDAERRSGKRVSLGHELRVSTQWGAIKRLIDEGRIGRPLYANYSLFRHPYRPGADGWRRDAARVGSWILEEPVHFFDLLMWYFADAGDPTRVSARGRSDAGIDGMYDNFSCHLDFDRGRYVTITQCLTGFEHNVVMEIAGSEGSLRTWWSGAGARSLTPTFELKVKARGADAPETIPLAASGEIFDLEEEMRQVIAAFRTGRTLVSAEESRKRVIVCLEAERSVREGRPVDLNF